ncbi:hypothetical protein V2J09_010278 [Rumex salicifolius]
MVANSSPSKLSLECKPQSCSILLKSLAVDHLQVKKIEEYLCGLEDERLKIDAFKRELPLCMQLLTNATSTTQGKRPILEEFIPIKHTNSEGPSDQHTTPNTNNSADKANWMTSAQLWSQTNEGATTTTTKQSASSKDYEIVNDPKLSLLDITNNDNNNNKQRNTTNGGAFLPFTKERVSNYTLPDLALTSNEREAEEIKCLKNENGFASESSRKVNGTNGMDITQLNVNGASATNQAHRKQRRCWSPDLHRRFVNALQMLGGSQVATPKQIRELMKVDGLTNDEVKSHLQKYRLHTRRPGPSPQQAGGPGPHLVVLGGIWVPPEYATTAAAHHHHMVQQSTIYGAHPTAQVGPHYCPPAIQHAEFYPPPLPNHHIHVFKASPQRQRSPESGGARDRSESIDDEKSGSSSWKGDSGESNEEMKMKKLVASTREGEEESNGSEITLKF